MPAPDSGPVGLMIIDMQNDFVLPSSPCCVRGAQATLPSARKLLDAVRARGWPVFHVVREYGADGVDVERPRVREFLELGGYSVPGTRGAEIVEELSPREGEYRIVKPRFSGFMHTRLDLILRRLGIGHVVICGTQYPNCIRATAFDALSLDYEVTVVTCATSAASDEVAEANIHDLRNVGIRCVSLEKLLEELEGSTAGHPHGGGEGAIAERSRGSGRDDAAVPHGALLPG